MTLTPGRRRARRRHEGAIDDTEGERERERARAQREIKRQRKRARERAWYEIATLGESQPVVPLASHATIGPRLLVCSCAVVVAAAGSNTQHTAHQRQARCVQS